MFLSKIWFVLVGLVAGVATTAAFVAPRSADRHIVELEGQRLDRAQYAAEQMLKADAHSWIDYTTKLSRDAVLAESLDAATTGKGEARLLHETVKGRLKTLVPELAGIGLDAVGAVDAKGRLIARLGDRENEQGESLAGLEVIGDALRGYLSDDVWGMGGRLSRVAAVPVLSKGRDHVVGAVFVAAETGKRLAEVWKKNLGVEIAILLRGEVRTSTLPESYFSALPAMVQEHADEISDAKRTRPLAIKVGADRLLAVAAPFVGQAGAQQGYFVLIGKMSPASDPLALLSTTTTDDLKWGNFPWLGLGLGLIVILGVGVGLQRLEMDRPLGRLRGEVQKLARGEIQKLDDHVYPGKFGGIARDVNAAIERFTLASPAKSETAKKDIGAILGPAPTEPASVFDLPQSHFGGGITQSPSAFAPPARPAPGAPPPLPPAFGPTAGPPAFGSASAPSFPSAPPPFPSASPPFPAAASPFGGTPAPTPFAAPAPFGNGSPAPFGGGTPGPAPFGSAPAPTAPRPAAPSKPSPLAPRPEARLAETPSAPMSLAQSALGLGSDGLEAPLDGGKLEDGGPGDADYEAHVRVVFDEYVATRERCGEPTASLTLDKFRTKLDANRDQLIAKYHCRTARFSVYVKDGKAALKAAPVR